MITTNFDDMMKDVPRRIAAWKKGVFTIVETAGGLVDSFVWAEVLDAAQNRKYVDLLGTVPKELREAMFEQLRVLPDESGKWHWYPRILVKYTSPASDEELALRFSQKYLPPDENTQAGIARLRSLLEQSVE